MPRDKNTGKRRGFAFLMYENQRSTILAVDNLNGAQVLSRTLRVDHVKDYKQKELVDGKWIDRETERLNARPELMRMFLSRLFLTPQYQRYHTEDEDDGNASEASSALSGFPDIDPDDPMRDYLIAQRKEQKLLEKAKKKESKRHANETPEERRERKERKRQKKLLKGGEGRSIEDRRRDAFDDRPRDQERDRDPRRRRSPSWNPPMRNRSRSPPARGYGPRRSRSREFHRDDHRSRP